MIPLIRDIGKVGLHGNCIACGLPAGALSQQIPGGLIHNSCRKSARPVAKFQGTITISELVWK